MIARCRVYFLVATLEYMAKGGRIGGASALLAGVLQVKPILTLRDGRVEAYDKARTQRRAVSRLKGIILEQYPRGRDGYLSVMHGAVPDEAKALADDLAAALGVSSAPILDVPPAIVVHAGPGVLGVGFFTE